MSRDSFLFFLLLCPGTGSSESDPWRVLVACFVTDNPSLQPLMCEVTVDDRMFIYYDSTLPSVQVLDSGLEEYRWILAKLVSDRERTIASLRREMAFIATISNSSPPNDFGELFLYPESEVTYGEMNVLTCLVNGAFPPTITVTLQMNGVPIDAGVNSSRLSFGEDWRFRVTRHAQIRPAAGDLYSCEVLHTISNEVKVVYWEPEVPEPWEESALDSGQLGTLAAGLIVGFLGTVAGYCLFFWPKVASHNFSLLRMRSSVRSSSSA